MSAQIKLHLHIGTIAEDIVLSPSDAAQFLSGLMGNPIELLVLEDNYGSIIVGPNRVIHHYRVSSGPTDTLVRNELPDSGRAKLIELLTRFIIASDQFTTNESFTV